MAAPLPWFTFSNPRGRDKKMVLVEAAEMADSLSTTGSISLNGIFFDTDKTDIRPESAPTLQEIAELLTDAPKMSVIVVGHTDNQGAFDTIWTSPRAAPIR